MNMYSRISSLSLRLTGGSLLVFTHVASAFLPEPPPDAQPETQQSAAEAARVSPPPNADAAPEDTASMIAMLKSRVLAEREAAENWLRSSDQTSLNDLLTALVRGELSPEQEWRITQAGRARFYERDPGALGVQFDGFDEDDGVFISGTIPTFAAADFLKGGDQIRSIDGMPILTSADVRAAILSRDPGEVIEVGVIRTGLSLAFKIPLGAYSKLPEQQNRGFGSPRDNDLESAWRVRLARVMRAIRVDGSFPPERREIRPPMSQERWERIDSRVDEARRSMVFGDRSVPRGGGGPPPMPNIALGGQPRSGTRFLQQGIGGGQGGPTRMAIPDLAEQRRQILQARRDQVQRLEGLLFATRNELERVKQRLQNDEVPAEARAGMERTRAELDRRAAEFDTLITDLRRQLAENE
jgi:hypothetical protein